eukprot:TRINITY_DN5387_c0_g4_i4.p1 TRINITY_DN5387_c0_g4~~TRINITY_DN5387_c0_g4_i4.p1  ORF type:complete len:199 (-),score=62.93 TRINITY_DN5387_c0_g4_i4:132-728(-)
MVEIVGLEAVVSTQSTGMMEGEIKASKEVRVVVSTSDVVDYTKLPKELERSYKLFDQDNALRPTIINTSKCWKKHQQDSLLSPPTKVELGQEDLEQSRNETFDLLDALSKSGNLVFQDSEIHVMITATHCFDKTLLETVVKDNVNPIDRVERSGLIMASTIHKKVVEKLVVPQCLEHIRQVSPMLFDLGIRTALEKKL